MLKKWFKEPETNPAIEYYERRITDETLPIEERVQIAEILKHLRSCENENLPEKERARKDTETKIGAALITGLLGIGGIIVGSAVKAHYNERYARNRECYERDGCYTSITDKSILQKGIDFT